MSVVYVLHEPLLAVRGDGQGFATLNANTTVVIEGEPDHAGLVPILCEGVRYRVFQRDVDERASAVGVSRAA